MNIAEDFCAMNENVGTGDLCQRVRRAPDTASARRWTLRADNHSHHHGVVSLSESPLYLDLSWKPTTDGVEQRVGLFRLDLPALLAGGYVRVEGDEADGKIRLRVFRSDDGKFWIQIRANGPAMQLPDVRGSQRWIREIVNNAPESLNEAIRSSMRLPPGERIRWHSPLAQEGFCEYRDREALHHVNAPPLNVPLSEFWPEGGPVWDALATTSGGALLFVEAKAHVRELVSPRSKAKTESLKRIEDALRVTRDFLAPGSRTDWSTTFYQYANRLAYLYFLRHTNQVNSHLVFLNFVGAKDVNGPTSAEAWDAAYLILHAALGMPERHPLSAFVHHVTIDVANHVTA
jgi:hypothetical protein